MSTFIIGEAASAHCGSYDRACYLIEKAKEAGCDAVKFQLFNNKLYNENTPDFGGYTSINKLMGDLELPRKWVPHLKKICDDLNIEFMATPFDEEAISILVDVGVKRLKVAAFESSDPRILRACAKTGLPLIVSLGVKSSPALVLKHVLETNPDCELTLLHCVSQYPTPPENVSLLTIQKLKELWKNVGYSDHTTDIITPALAVALGANIIEKHFCSSRLFDNPDCKFALEPDELTQMVKNIRETEQKLTYHHSNIEGEQINATRSIYVRLPIKMGEVFTESNISTSRPFFEGNVPASSYYEYIGKTSNKNYDIGDPIENYIL